jgi:hypothetical protein
MGFMGDLQGIKSGGEVAMLSLAFGGPQPIGSGWKGVSQACDVPF